MFVFCLEFQSSEEYTEFVESLQIPALGGFPDTVDDWFHSRRKRSLREARDENH